MSASALHDIRVVSLAVNVPGPATMAQLCRLGAAVTKVEPPGGDPLERVCPAWYEALRAGQRVLRLDLKDADGRRELERLLAESDLLLTATRPAALARLGLGWPELHARLPRLAQVAMVGYPAPDDDRPGHDLTYLAGLGLLAPPALPRTLLADLAAAERAVIAALALLLARERGGEAAYAEVSIVAVAEGFAAPWRHGVTRPDGVLGGALPGYNLYQARQGWIAVAALEPHFWQHLVAELGLAAATRGELARLFLTRDAEEWERWGAARDLPIAALRETPPVTEERS